MRFFLHHCWPALLNKDRACSSIPLGTVRRQQMAPNDGQLLSSGSLIHMDRALSEGLTPSCLSPMISSACRLKIGRPRASGLHAWSRLPLESSSCNDAVLYCDHRPCHRDRLSKLEVCVIRLVRIELGEILRRLARNCPCNLWQVSSRQRTPVGCATLVLQHMV